MKANDMADLEKKVGFKFNLLAENSPIGDNTIVLTGLSGSYYDYLYLGFKVIYFHFGYALEHDLPRAQKAVLNFDEFMQQYKQVFEMSQDCWFSHAGPVVQECFGVSIHGARSLNLIDEISSILSDLPQQE
jgi:hypothetical protein